VSLFVSVRVEQMSILLSMMYSVILYSWTECTRPEIGETSQPYMEYIVVAKLCGFAATNVERSPSSKFHSRSGQDLALPELVVHCPVRPCRYQSTRSKAAVRHAVNLNHNNRTVWHGSKSRYDCDVRFTTISQECSGPHACSQALHLEK
jgi:hypothetical protein